MVVDCDRLFTPYRAVLIEVADQLLFLGVDANDRQFTLLEKVSHFGDVLELFITIRMRSSGQAFAITYERDFVFFRS